MSIWDKVVGIVNKTMNTTANSILEELKYACPKDSGKTAASFHIMGGGEDATVSVSGRGLIRSVRIGSNELSAYYAAYGNGGRGRIIRPTHAKALHLKDGSYRSQVHGYTPPSNFVKDVADRHR